MRVGNHSEQLLQYFHYPGQGFKRISFLESISSYIEGRWSHLNHSITFKDFTSYPIYDVLEIPWPGIRKSWSKHDHPSTRCLWCIRSKDHVHNRDINQPDSLFGIIPFRDLYRSIQWTLSPKSTHYLSLVSQHLLPHDQSYSSYESDQIVLFFPNNSMSSSNIPR